MFRYITFLGAFLLLMFACLGCDKKQVDKSACGEKQVQQILTSSEKVSKSKRHIFLYRSLLKKCPKMNVFIRSFVQSQLQWYEFDPRKAALPFGKVVRLKDHSKLWDRACPGIPMKDWTKIEDLSFGAKERYLFEHCGGSGKEFLTQKELLSSCSISKPTFLQGAIFFRWLLDAGVKKNIAREFVRDSFLAGYRPSEIPLLSWKSGTPLRHLTRISITQTKMLVNRRMTFELKDGRVAPSLKMDKQASSYMILPLYERLKEALSKGKKIAKYTKEPFKRELLLYVDPKVPFRTLAEVMYTAGQAEFKHFYLAVDLSNPPYQGCTQMLPITASTRVSPTQKDLGSANLTVMLGQKSFQMVLRGERVGKNCDLKTFHRANRSYRVKNGSYRFPPSKLGSRMMRRGVPSELLTTERLREILSKGLGRKLDEALLGKLDKALLRAVAQKKKRKRKRTRRRKRRRKRAKKSVVLKPKAPIKISNFLEKRIESKTEYRVYTQCLQKIHSLIPYDGKLIVMVDPSLSFRELVTLLRAGWTDKDGKPLFRKVVLSAGLL